MDVGLLLRDCPLLRRSGRHFRRYRFHFHGLDFGKGHVGDARVLLVVVDPFPERHCHFDLFDCQPVIVI